jgi:tetratricopeptide (TPR) repeat protein
VYYNLGNAYFKAGNFAKAILNYERARKLNPDDEDITFNLKLASLKVVDKIETVPVIFYKRWIEQLSSFFNADTWATLLIMLVWVLFIVIAIYFMGRTVAIKKISFLFIIILCLLTFSTGIIAARSHARSSIDQQAIIMSSSVYVKSSPTEKGNDLFILHEGTKVDVLDELNEWSKIKIANGSIGWVLSGEMTKI